MSRKRDAEIADMIGKPISEKMEQLEEAVRKDGELTRAEYTRQIGEVEKVVDIVVEDLSARGKKELYDLNTVVDIVDLEDNEKEFLVAVLYTLARMSDEITGLQQGYIRSVKNYLGIKNVQEKVDLSYIENIDSKQQTKAILQTVMEYLFLENCNHDYLEKYGDILDYFVVKPRDICRIQECIDAIYKAVGAEGLAEKYGFVPEEESAPEFCSNATEVSLIEDDVADRIGIKNNESGITVNTSFVETNNYVLFPTWEEKAVLTIINKRSGVEEAYAMGNGFYATKIAFGDNVLFKRGDPSECCVLNLGSKEIIEIGSYDHNLYDTSLLTDRFFIYRNSNSWQVTDISTGDTWEVNGVINSSIHWGTSNIVAVNNIMYYLEEVEGEYYSILCKYDLLKRVSKPLCGQHFDTGAPIAYRNNKVYVFSSEDDRLKVFEIQIDSAGVKEIASVASAWLPNTKLLNVTETTTIVFGYEDDNDEYNLCILDTSENTISTLAKGVNSLCLAVVGKFIYYLKEHCVYRICLDDLQTLRIS